MRTKSPKQFDLFFKEQFLWQRQSKQSKNQLCEQLALLLLSCFKAKEQHNQPYKENPPCPVK